MSVAIAGGGDELLANPGDLLVPGDVLNPSLPYPLTAANADGANVPVITTAGDYKYVGKLVVGFDQAGNVIAVDETASGPLRVSGVAPASFVSVVPSIPPMHFKEILENAVSRIPLADGRFAQGRGLRVHLRRLRAGARGGQRRQRPHSRREAVTSTRSGERRSPRSASPTSRHSATTFKDRWADSSRLPTIPRAERVVSPG